ncbi:dimethylamine monooxygenase subunit DmmA family protein [Acinetobacter terrae]|uniref:dimethylamine monooxygenase subunit DmmA family protein n=1 Tax=Acinetobacter terrae TaxID=2731247 RepID=UPI0007D839BE|nr:dimethylamine monooxygenase subunit DmmA family protein [Acinetobacter terrae]OAL83111.1 hypothetical protein AY608_15375 [Acinetobacter terrae]
MQDAMLSTPIYQELCDLSVSASRHLLILQDGISEEGQQFIELQQHSQVYQLNLDSGQPDQALQHLLHQMSAFLQQQRAGLNVVIYGDEYFLWQVYPALKKYGFLKEEIHLVISRTLSTPNLKQVYCVHCGHIQKTCWEDFCHCEQCNVHLLIRRHFSERLGAYMGVCADAQHPMGVHSS